MSLAARLQSLMRRRGIRSQNQLARLSGVSQTSIHRILNGAHRRMPSVEVLTRLARAVDCSPAWLIHGDLPTGMPPLAPLRTCDPDEREWSELYRQLDAQGKHALLAMAKVLSSRSAPQ